MTRAAALVIGAALATACTVDTAVLIVPDAGGSTTCAQVLAGGEGVACVGELRCERPVPLDPACCAEFVVCIGNQVTSLCDPCKACEDDRGCPAGVEMCINHQCKSCLDPSQCPPCPPDFEPLLRNGCPTCFCAPRSECHSPDECLPTDSCYPGQVCAAGCAPGDLACCANACGSTAPTCQSLAPVGCEMRCPPGSPCPSCVAMKCHCDGGVWSCLPGCGPPPANGECPMPPPPPPPP